MKTWNSISGWHLNSREAKLLYGILCCCASPLAMAEQAQQIPSVELLEFLGEQLTSDDDQLDPMLWQEEEKPEFDLNGERNRHED